VRALAEQRVAELRAAGVTARTSAVSDVDPARGITRRAEATGAALVAVARHRGHAGLGRAVLGPVALRVVRHAPAPVLVGPRGIEGVRRF
jgi:nucleotide-binding universal stress UspA family protein